MCLFVWVVGVVSVGLVPVPAPILQPAGVGASFFYATVAPVCWLVCWLVAGISKKYPVNTDNSVPTVSTDTV